MIGEPGADKILVATGHARLLPLDSNGLRVLERLQLAPGGRDYRSAYRRAQDAVAPQLPRQTAALLAAYSLLRLHGQRLCRRSRPICSECPLRLRCPSADRVRRGA
jgi:endonuclease-3 related protein